MGFFASGEDKKPVNSKLPSKELLHKLECKGCPLDRIRSNRSPHMEPTGSKRPLVYFLGPMPSEADDENGEQFTGNPGRLLQHQIPREFKKDAIRYNHVVRCKTKSGEPQFTEIECCRPSIVRDIEETKPDAIFGFGPGPLYWALHRSGINDWRGRRIPIVVGTHRCWFYPMLSPDYIHRLRNKHHGEKSKAEKADWEHVWEMDLKRAFKEVAAGLPPPAVHLPAQATDGVEWLTGRPGDLDKLERFLRRAAEADAVGVDYETTALRPYRTEAEFVTCSVAIDGYALAWPFHHPQARWTPSELKKVYQIWGWFLRQPKVRKAVHNLPFEMEWSAVKMGEDVLRAGLWEDTMVQAAILDERVGNSKPGCLSLDFLVLQHFGLSLKELSPLNKANLKGEPLEDVLRYNGMDAKYHLALFRAQNARLEDEGLQSVYEQHLPRIPTVVLTQIKGLHVDFQMVQSLSDKYQGRLEQLEKEIWALPCCDDYYKKFGKEYSPTANDDHKRMLWDVLGFDNGWDEKRDKYSTDEDVLKTIDHPIAKLVLEHRHATKRLSTYVEPLKPHSKLVYPGGLLHPIINTVFAETGRTTSEQPNEQNFPKRDSEARELRRQVSAPKGQIIAACDYGQIQVRNIAMESGDKVLIQYLWDRHDFHMDWTRKLAQAHPPRIGGEKYLEDKKALKTFRTDVKNQWTFPLFFGAKLSTACYYLDMPERAVKPLYDEFWDTFSGVRNWQQRLVDTYRRKGYVENLTGRRRRAPLSENQIINSPIQADEADIVLSAMARLSETGDTHLQAIMNIHDDLTFQLPTDNLDGYVDTIIETMISPPFDFINVPIVVEVSIGGNWCDLEEVIVASSDTWKK